MWASIFGFLVAICRATCSLQQRTSCSQMHHVVMLTYAGAIGWDILFQSNLVFPNEIPKQFQVVDFGRVSWLDASRRVPVAVLSTFHGSVRVDLQLAETIELSLQTMDSITVSQPVADPTGQLGEHQLWTDLYRPHHVWPHRRGLSSTRPRNVVFGHDELCALGAFRRPKPFLYPWLAEGSQQCLGNNVRIILHIGGRQGLKKELRVRLCIPPALVTSM